MIFQRRMQSPSTSKLFREKSKNFWHSSPVGDIVIGTKKTRFEGMVPNKASFLNLFLVCLANFLSFSSSAVACWSRHLAVDLAVDGRITSWCG